MLNRLRRRLDLLVERRVDALLSPRLVVLSEEFQAMQRDYDARLGGTQADFSFMRSEFDRIAPQLAALEQRFEWLRVRLADDQLHADDAASRAMAEHERARIRLELASHYEERLRRLEAEQG
ncbi:hypothetical protein H9633_01525 [Microbacterium sp. Re1]|uniref:Uncharacterized protein n=1 Tax=Microbacterium commune TaxID=2762219 RepID=A0ABR8W1R2_9MICO|nr:hypothetical protein [Microbacterium commune]MBD8010977.1 hypothetical protein [Microbacterium commune]